jgi:hypothetical protein
MLNQKLVATLSYNGTIISKIQKRFSLEPSSEIQKVYIGKLKI